jgi:hypothetical protein
VISPTKICRSYIPFCGRSEDKQANKHHGAGNRQNEICNSVETLARHSSFCLGMEEGSLCTLLLLTSSFRSRLFIIFLHLPSWFVIIEFLLPDFPSLVAHYVTLPTSRMATPWVQCVRHAGPGSGDTNWQSVSTAVCCHRTNSKPIPTDALHWDPVLCSQRATFLPFTTFYQLLSNTKLFQLCRLVTESYVY